MTKRCFSLPLSLSPCVCVLGLSRVFWRIIRRLTWPTGIERTNHTLPSLWGQIKIFSLERKWGHLVWSPQVCSQIFDLVLEFYFLNQLLTLSPHNSAKVFPVCVFSPLSQVCSGRGSAGLRWCHELPSGFRNIWIQIIDIDGEWSQRRSALKLYLF